MADGMRPLRDLTRLVFDAELARLRAASEEVRACIAAADGLAAEAARRGAEVSAMDGAPDLALRTGQDARWQAWLGRERARLAREAAQAAARREAQRKVAERAFGRLEALARVQEKLAADRSARRARRPDS